MKVLVAYVSKHGSTREISEAICSVLSEAGLTVDLREAGEVESIVGFDAVVLGSAIYIGQWQPGAVKFIDRNSEALSRVPVWLFSSGPIGEDPFPKEDPPVTPKLVEKTRALGYRSFAGKLDRSSLGLGERLVSRVVRAPEGDFRNWTEIGEWAREIAVTLCSQGTPVRETA